MKPKINSKQPERDLCMTPPYAVPPLLEHIRLEIGSTMIWECASGEGDLAKELSNHGLLPITSDLSSGKDFLSSDTSDGGGILPNMPIITNPPYSKKIEFVKRCYELADDWALLLPVESLASSKLNEIFQKHGGISVIFFDSRIDFKLPGGTWGKSSAQFPTCWIVSGFGLEKNKMYYSSIKQEKSDFKRFHRENNT